jgi:hypothetical protein
MKDLQQEIKRLRRILAEGLYTDHRTIMLLTDEIISIEEVLYDSSRKTETTNESEVAS